MNLIKKMVMVATCMIVSATFVACDDSSSVSVDIDESASESSSSEKKGAVVL